MLHISKQADYAAQLLIKLSEQPEGEYLSLRKFSQDFNISFLFLQRIARALKDAGYIDATRGVYGGYFLTIDPKLLSVKDVIEAIEGPFGVSACARGENCPRMGTCAVEPIFKNVNIQVIEILEKTPLVT